MNISRWDQRFLALAQHIADWSKDPSTKVGAVIVDSSNRVVSLGSNGFPRGVRDDHRLEDRGVKYDLIVHAEVNAILFAGRDVAACTLYGWPLPPCSNCAGAIIQAGIGRVVSPWPKSDWLDRCQIGRGLLIEAGLDTLWVHP